IRLPDLTVPVATHLPWNPRHPDTGAPEQVIAMQGSSHFFPATTADREIAGDPRPSIEERYESLAAYCDQVRAAAISLASEGYLLPDDVDIVVDACAARYGAAVGTPTSGA
ncbi:MAG: alpha/beta hydrolase domain-containing protein, partial [Dehalococcoidia bacterium]